MYLSVNSRRIENPFATPAVGVVRQKAICQRLSHMSKYLNFCRMWTSRPIFVTYLPHYEITRSWSRNCTGWEWHVTLWLFSAFPSSLLFSCLGQCFS